jgi:phospholipid-binding lipoprotein MlaA
MIKITPLLCLAVGLALGACAAVPSDPVDRAAFEANRDPLEPMNRTIFDINNSIDRAVIKPVAIAYRDATPPAVRESIFNLGANLGEPLIFVNGALQGRFGLAAKALVRFATNSTVGIGGLFDMAAQAKLMREETDFGETLYIWGVKDDGPYLVLPLFGSSNLRDAFGKGVDAVINPLGLVTRGSLTRSVLTGTGDKEVLDNGNAQFEFASMGISILAVIDLRSRYIEEVEELERSSLDFYAKLRSVSRQRRDGQLGKPKSTTNAAPVALSDPGP